MSPTTLLVVGTIASVGGQLISGMQQQRMAEYSAKVSKLQADQARKKGKFDAQRQREMTRKMLATQRARFAQMGVGLEGSPLFVMEETAKEGELDARAIEYGGEVEAFGHEANARLSRYEGRVAMGSSIMRAGTTLLSGVARYRRETQKNKYPPME